MNRKRKAEALTGVFEQLKPSIIAFASRIANSSQHPIVPPIIGTGFFVDPRGIAVTNTHVVEALKALPRHPHTGESAAFAIVFTKMREHNGKLRMHTLYVNIRGYKTVKAIRLPGRNYGELVPDYSFVSLNICKVPAIALSRESDFLRPGLDVATAGFPLGGDPLKVYGSVNQLTPFLRRGIVSSVLPFSVPLPHGFTIDIMSQGGASGSPIFLVDQCLAVGILHAGYPGTNITYGVPSYLFASALEQAYNSGNFDLTGVPTLDNQTAEADKEQEGTFGFERL